MHNGSKGSLSLGKRSSSSVKEEGEEKSQNCVIFPFRPKDGEGSMVLEGTLN